MKMEGYCVKKSKLQSSICSRVQFLMYRHVYTFSMDREKSLEQVTPVKPKEQD